MLKGSLKIHKGWRSPSRAPLLPRSVIKSEEAPQLSLSCLSPHLWWRPWAGVQKHLVSVSALQDLLVNGRCWELVIWSKCVVTVSRHLPWFTPRPACFLSPLSYLQHCWERKSSLHVWPLKELFTMSGMQKVLAWVSLHFLNCFTGDNHHWPHGKNGAFRAENMPQDPVFFLSESLRLLHTPIL